MRSLCATICWKRWLRLTQPLWLKLTSTSASLGKFLVSSFSVSPGYLFLFIISSLHEVIYSITQWCLISIAMYKSLPSYICINPTSIYVLIITVNLLIIYLWKTLLFGFLLFFFIIIIFFAVSNGFCWKYLLDYIVIGENSNLAFLLWLWCACGWGDSNRTGYNLHTIIRH